MEESKTRHSLWLVPEQPERRHLQNLIDQLSSRLDSPKFCPHITVLGDIAVSAEHLFRAAKPLAESTACLRLEIKRLETGSSYFQSLFLRIDDKGSLRQMHQQAAFMFPNSNIPTTYLPHISLAYGHFSRDQIEQAKEIIGAFLPMVVRFDRLSIVQSSDTTPVSKWTTRGDLLLTQRDYNASSSG